MTIQFLLGQAATTEGRDMFVGFVAIIGTLWLVCWIFKPRDKGWEYSERRKGILRKRK